MSEEQKSGGAAADKSGAQGGADSKDKKVVPFDDHDRALKDLHKFKALAKEYESKLQETEQSKLMAEGKKDELIANLQKSVTELKTKSTDMQKTFAWDKVKGWLKAKAAPDIKKEDGALENFVSLVKFDGRNPFVDETTFALDENVLGQVFDDSRKKMPYFFKDQSKQIRDTTPGATDVSGNVDYSKMSLDQMRELARKSN